MSAAYPCERTKEREKENEGDKSRERRGVEERKRKARDERERGGARGAVRNAWERGASGPTAICPSRIPPTPRRALGLFSAP